MIGLLATILSPPGCGRPMRIGYRIVSPVIPIVPNVAVAVLDFGSGDYAARALFVNDGKYYTGVHFVHFVRLCLGTISKLGLWPRRSVDVKERRRNASVCCPPRIPRNA